MDFANDPSALLSKETLAAAENSYGIGGIPSFGGNLAFGILFGILLAAQLGLGLYYSQWKFMLNWACALILSCLGYAGRIWFHFDIESSQAFMMQSICLNISARFVLSGMYFVMSKFVYVYGEQFTFVKPSLSSIVLIITDVIAVVLQSVGNVLMIKGQWNVGRSLLLFGLALQIFTIFVFQVIWYSFCLKISKTDKPFMQEYESIRNRKQFPLLFPIFSLAILCLFVRSIYRLIKTVEGWNSSLFNNETDFFCLDALMILLAVVALTIYYPGFAFGKGTKIRSAASLAKAVHDDEKSSFSTKNGKSPFRLKLAIF